MVINNFFVFKYYFLISLFYNSYLITHEMLRLKYLYIIELLIYYLIFF